jgi:hypothetical protein
MPLSQTQTAPVGPPEKRKVGSSILSLTTSPEKTYAALTRENVSCCGRPPTLLFARSHPLVTASRRTLVHAECTEFAAGLAPPARDEPDDA